MKFSFGTGDLVKSRKASFRVEAALEESASMIVRIIQALTPKKSGETATSWNARRVNSRRWEVFSNYKVARWLEEGTGIHGPTHLPIPVRAKRAKALRWDNSNEDNSFGSGNEAFAYRDPASGTRIGVKGRSDQGGFAKRVLIKGIQPRHYAEFAIKESMPLIEARIAEAALQDIEERLGIRVT